MQLLRWSGFWLLKGGNDLVFMRRFATTRHCMWKFMKAKWWHKYRLQFFSSKSPFESMRCSEISLNPWTWWPFDPGQVLKIVMKISIILTTYAIWAHGRYVWSCKRGHEPDMVCTPSRAPSSQRWRGRVLGRRRAPVSLQGRPPEINRESNTFKDCVA